MGKTTIVGGMPTAPDVRALIDAFPNLTPGTVIAYDEVRAVVRGNDARLRTVTNAWRRALLRERNVRIGVQKGVGFEVLSDSDRLRVNVHDFAGVARKTRKVAEDVERIDASKLSTPERAGREHLSRLARAQLDAARAAQREIAAQLNPPKQLPRTVPIVSSR